VAGAWSWPSTSILCRGQECVDLYLHSPNTPSWGSVQLTHEAMYKSEDRLVNRREITEDDECVLMVVLFVSVQKFKRRESYYYAVWILGIYARAPYECTASVRPSVHYASCTSICPSIHIIQTFCSSWYFWSIWAKHCTLNPEISVLTEMESTVWDMKFT
jgi:hypothetical protein